MKNQILEKLLADGLAVMEPNDPARSCLRASLIASADTSVQRLALYFYNYSGAEARESYGSGATPGEALANFAQEYSPPLTTAGRIAALKAELAALEGIS